MKKKQTKERDHEPQLKAFHVVITKKFARDLDRIHNAAEAKPIYQ